MSLIDIRDIERSFMQKSSFEPLHLEKTLYSINFTIALYQIAKHMSIKYVVQLPESKLKFRKTIYFPGL